MKNFVKVGVTAFVGCMLTQAEASATYSSPEAFVQSFKSKITESVRGDLNGDGLKDWVGAVAPASGEDAEMHKVVVLLQRSSGNYEMAGSSDRFSWSNSGSGVATLELEIKKSTFYVLFTSNTWGCASSERYQFRLESGWWRMIGATYRESNTTDPNVSIWYSQDANLVTGDEILTVQGFVNERKRFSPLLLDLRKFPFGPNKVFRTKAKSVCG